MCLNPSVQIEDLVAIVHSYMQLHKLTLGKMLSTIDVNRDGQIQLDELHAFIARLVESPVDPSLQSSTISTSALTPKAAQETRGVSLRQLIGELNGFDPSEPAPGHYELFVCKATGRVFSTRRQAQVRVG